MKRNAIIINPADNVAVTLVDILKGKDVVVDGKHKVVAMDDIPYSHKVALKDFSSGEPIIKYGESIGEANQEIKKGQWIHSHNLGVGGEILG